MESYSGYTPDGVEITCTINQEKGESCVEYNGEKYIRFAFNPDFPEDAKSFFIALCNVREITIDE